MNESSPKAFFDLCAADLMSRQLVTIPLGTSLRDAAGILFQNRLHGAPVLDGSGRCAGILSVSDLARWAVNRDSPPPALPRTCNHQDTRRELTGATTLCLLERGACSLQKQHVNQDGSAGVACGSPNDIPVDWQIVEMQSLPEEDVKHYMTTGAAAVLPDTPIVVLARRMMTCRVQRIVVEDKQQRLLGMVSLSDIVAAVAGIN